VLVVSGWFCGFRKPPESLASIKNPERLHLDWNALPKNEIENIKGLLPNAGAPFFTEEN
jgi:hypothetical protein